MNRTYELKVIAKFDRLNANVQLHESIKKKFIIRIFFEKICKIMYATIAIAKIMYANVRHREKWDDFFYSRVCL